MSMPTRGFSVEGVNGASGATALVSAVLIIDEHGQVIHISDSLRSALRLGEDVHKVSLETLGLGPTATVELSHAINRVMIDGKPFRAVLSILAGGLRMWNCELFPSLLNEGAVDSVTIIITDVTPDRSDDTMGRSISMMDVINNTPGLFLIFNADTSVVRYVNPITQETARQFNIELKGHSILELVPRSSELYRIIYLAKRTLVLQSFNAYAGKRMDGKDLYLRVAVFPIKEKNELVLTASDTTMVIEDRLKALTENLANAHARLESILAVLPVGVLIINPEGDVVEENQAIRSIWRHSGSLSSEAALSALEDQEIVKLSKMIKDLLGRGMTLNGHREIIHRVDGTQGTILVSAVPLKEKGKSHRDYVAVVQDITEIATLEEELKKGSETLARSNAELQQFAYVASHDLREPLRMVSSYLELIEKKYSGKVLDSKALEYMDYAIDGAVRMSDMINDLLVYSRVETMGKERSPVDMNGVYNAVIKDLKVSIEENKASITRDELPVIPGDSSQMVQLMENLIGNAIKFRGEEPPQIHVSATQKEDEWLFSVKDNGIGIDPKYAGRIFQMFHRLHTREEYPGTGIGLAIAKKIVERHGGNIWFESEPGKGSTFFFTIPATN